MKRTDSVFIEGLRLKARVGIYPQEKKRAQPIEINLRIVYTRKKTTDIRDVISYETAVIKVRRIIAQKHYDLLETLADSIIKAFFEHRAVSRVEIDISKPNLPVLAPKVFKNTRKIGISVAVSK
jgi:dihydroneopterin aldolase